MTFMLLLRLMVTFHKVTMYNEDDKELVRTLRGRLQSDKITMRLEHPKVMHPATPSQLKVFGRI